MLKAQPIRRMKKVTAMVNPHRKPKAKARRHKPSSGAPRRNPAETILLGILNPEKRQMKRKTKRKNPVIRRRSTAKKANPIKARRRHAPRSIAPRRKTRRNPDARSILNKPIDLLKMGGVGAVAFFLTRQLPQYVLKEKNASWMGYLANVLTAIACAAAADRYFGAASGSAAFVGGGMYTFSRILDDQTPLGKQLNLTAQLSGLRGDVRAAAGMGAIVPGYWTSPAVTGRDGAPKSPRPSLTRCAPPCPLPRWQRPPA